MEDGSVDGNEYGSPLKVDMARRIESKTRGPTSG